MGRAWILDTETKGTGAHMVPLDSVTKRPSTRDQVFVLREPASPREPTETEEPTPRAPHRFKIVDLMTRRTLAEDASTHQAVSVMMGVRSVVDVNVYVWDDEKSDWRLLTQSEKRAVWDLAHP
jgi:hypothetical protein